MQATSPSKNTVVTGRVGINNNSSNPFENCLKATTPIKSPRSPRAYVESFEYILIILIENESTNKEGLNSKMIFPIRCITCNNIIGGKWLSYLDKVKEYRKESGKTEMEYLTATTEKTAEGKALDDLNVKKVCCRRHFLAHVDLL